MRSISIYVKIFVEITFRWLMLNAHMHTRTRSHAHARKPLHSHIYEKQTIKSNYFVPVHFAFASCIFFVNLQYMIAFSTSFVLCSISTAMIVFGSIGFPEAS